MSVKFKSNADKIIKKFNNMMLLVDNFQPALTKVLGNPGSSEPWTLRGGTKFSFENEISPINNKKFKELTRPYNAWKDKNFSSDLPILHLTGQLYESLVYTTGYSIAQILPKKLIFGTSIPYAAVHNYGSTKKNIPSRQFLGFRKNQKERIELEIRRFAVDAWKRRTTIEGGA